MPESTEIPAVWAKAGDDFSAALVERGCTMEEIAMLCSGAGAFASYLDLVGWKLTPPGE